MTRLFVLLGILTVGLTGCVEHEDAGSHSHHETHKIVATTPLVKDVTLTQQFVCQIHSQRHINVRALENGYLEQIPIREGQAVKAGDVLFRVMPALYKARLDAELAEVRLAELELENTRRLLSNKVVSTNEVALFEAKLAKAQAKADLAKAELNFTEVKAPFDGIVDRLHEQHGSLIKEGDILTTLSDNRMMWVYFNVPESRYLDYMTNKSHVKDYDHIELLLANGAKFPHPGAIAAIEATFNSETGNIPFRADFPNPEGLLRHGQTGNVHIHRTLKNVMVIPQRATFEILDKRYVYVIGEDHVVRQRAINIQHEMDDVFVVGEGLQPQERIVLDGVRQVRDGQHVEFEFHSPADVIAHQKKHAE